ncbi:MAG TPA: serine/threonine-protein kinase [Vicinamibacterales bacterium]|nr:serine/threonine-protein kinase [Vicinamibacterales bacterium]
MSAEALATAAGAVTGDWDRVGALFDEVLALDAGAREARLARADAADPAVAAEVRALLHANDRSGGAFLERPAWAEDPELLRESAAETPLTGRRIGPYEVREEVGRGGMGVVYAAEDARLGRSVALKMLPPAYSRDPVARERLAREARAAAALSHACIATVFALEEIDGDLYIASELVRGTTLRAALASGPIPRDRLIDTLVQIAEALDAAHRHGIVHRDLKPENVLRTEDGRIKVVDFGIARMLTPMPEERAGLTLTGTHLGTPGYMAPEQLRGQPVDARADVFAFGVMGYELATGTHPFGGSDPAALLERLVSDDPPLSRPIDPPGLDVIIRSCVKGTPAARFASGSELLQALRALQTSTGAAAAYAIAVPRTAWWWKFHQVAVAVLTIAAVIVVGLRRQWIGHYGSVAFLVVLVLATVSTTLRLHMWFVSQVQPALLAALRARVLRVVVIFEWLLLTMVMGIGISLSGVHDGTSAQLVVTAVLLLLSLLVIEPATTRASLPG